MSDHERAQRAESPSPTAKGAETTSVNLWTSHHARAGQSAELGGASVEAPLSSSEAQSAELMSLAPDEPGGGMSGEGATVDEQAMSEVGLVAHDGEPPLRLRASPDTEGDNVIGALPFNTRLQVIGRARGGWYHVSLPSGQTGYAAAVHIRTHLPEPNARLHRVEGGAKGTAIGIAERYYEEHADDWGQDLRFYVGVLGHLNRLEVPDTSDAWRDVGFQAGQFIWVPSVAFARGLRGVINSGSLTYEAASALGVAEGIERVGQALDDLRDAIALSRQYLGAAIAHHVEEALVNALVSLGVMLVGGAAFLALSTAAGAALGALAGGVGAAPGAAAGFEAGLALLEWIGLGFLGVWIGSSLARLGAGFGEFLGAALSANGDEAALDDAARSFADTVGTLLGVAIEGLAVFAAQAGVARVAGMLRGTKLGEAVGATRLGEWLSARTAAVRSGEGPVRGVNQPRHEGRPDAKHELGQSNRMARGERGGGRVEWLGNNQRGIEGFWVPRGGGEKIPFSLKDFSNVGKMRNMIRRINDNATKIEAEGFERAVLFITARQWRMREVQPFVEGGPIGRMPNEGVFSRIVFECADGIFAIGEAIPIPLRLPQRTAAPLPNSGDESRAAREASDEH